MSRLSKSLIVLDKGLNLQTPKIAAPEGSVLDSLNYEQVDFQGQKRIDGFLRYDGQLPSDIEEYRVLTTDVALSVNVGDLIISDTGFYGIVLFVDGTTVHAAEYNPNVAPVVGTEDATLGATVTANVAGATVAADADEHYNNLIAYNDVLRDKVGSLPGPVAGLHWFRDRLYAVANLPIISIDGTTPTIYPTDTISVNGVEAEVVAAFTLDNTRQVFVDHIGSAEFTTAGNTVLVNGVDGGATLDTYETGDVVDIASFFDSRTEQQVIEEDTPPYTFGWRHLPTGWMVYFTNGVSLYGSLTAVNQHPATDGAKGSTPTSGTTGKPTILNQKVKITNLPAQVNGWKTSTFTTVYGLNNAALDDIDSYTIYADAYISWNSTTGAISAPGANGSNLTEYPATATG